MTQNDWIRRVREQWKTGVIFAILLVTANGICLFWDGIRQGYHGDYGKIMLFGSILIVLMYLVCVNLTRIYDDVRNDHKRVFYYFAIALVGISIIVYWQYLTGKAVYIFDGRDIASDSLYQTYPELVYMAEKISKGVWLEHWNSFQALGGTQGLLYPTLNHWVAFFGAENVAYLMGFSQFLKVLMAGFFFYGYLRTIKISRGVSSVFAMGYAYCSQMILRGAWRSFPSEVVLVAVWLFFFERFYVKKDYKWLPLATGYFFLNLNGYYTILYTGIFCMYGFFRYYSEHSFKETNRHTLREHAMFAGSILIGWLIAAISCIPSISSLLNSNRFQNASGGFSWNISELFSPVDVYQSGFLRSLGNNVVGIGREHVRWTNTLNDAAFYCGLLTLMLVIVGIVSFQKRKKVWYLLGYGAITAYIIVVPLRRIANGLRDEWFLMSSFWIIVLLLLTAAQGCENVRQSGKKLNVVLLSTVIAGYMGCALLSYMDGVDKKYFVIALALILIYGMLLFAVYRKISFAAFNIIVIILMLGEIVVLSGPAVNNRGVLSGDAIKQKMYYNDYTVEAVDYLKETDDTVYRVDKNYNSVFLCDSLYQGYSGTKGYIGGGGISNVISDFYVEMGFPIYRSNHYAYGFAQSTAINTLLNVKYIMTKAEEANNYGYEFADKTGDVYIYRNENALPLGSSYDKYILKEDFDKLTIAEKRNVIMQACVLEERPKMDGMQEMPEEEMLDSVTAIENFQQYTVPFETKMMDNRYSISFEPINEDEVAVIRLNVTNSNSALYAGSNYTTWGDTIYFGGSILEDSYASCFVQGTNEYVYELNQNGTDHILFGIYNGMEVNEAEVYVFPKDVYYKGYLNSVSKLSENGMEITSHSENEIKGLCNNNKAKLLFWAIPYHENWHLYIDGKQTSIIPANVGFLGGYIPAGRHEVVLKYEADMSYGMWSLLGIGLFALYFIICIRMRKDRRAND